MTPSDQIATKRVVLAGQKLMYDAKTFPIFRAGMMKQMPMPQKLATEAAGLVKTLQDKANGAIPRQVLIPAATMLILEIAKFMKDAKIGDPTPQDIQAAYQLLVPIMAKAFPRVEPRIAPGAAQSPAGSPTPRAAAAPPPRGIIGQAQVQPGGA